jgi:hypothetical protein
MLPTSSRSSDGLDAAPGSAIVRENHLLHLPGDQSGDAHRIIDRLQVFRAKLSQELKSGARTSASSSSISGRVRSITVGTFTNG